MSEIPTSSSQKTPADGDSIGSIEALASWMRHDTTRITSLSPMRAGVTRWCCTGAKGDAWVEWDWQELQPEVVAQADPMAVRSCLVLLDRHGEHLATGRRVIALANLSNLLPWHGPVLDALYPGGAIAAARV